MKIKLNWADISQKDTFRLSTWTTKMVDVWSFFIELFELNHLKRHTIAPNIVKRMFNWADVLQEYTSDSEQSLGMFKKWFYVWSFLSYNRTPV